MARLSGQTAAVSVATRGTDGPGEVIVRAGGGSESYIAWSDEPIARGQVVLIIEDRGARNLYVRGM
jgi:hypothetical protein